MALLPHEILENRAVANFQGGASLPAYEALDRMGAGGEAGADDQVCAEKAGFRVEGGQIRIAKNVSGHQGAAEAAGGIRENGEARPLGEIAYLPVAEWRTATGNDQAFHAGFQAE